MHDGSIGTLREVMQHYSEGGISNPHLSPRMRRLDLTPEEIDALVAMMEALDGENEMESGPKSFPQ